jgi:beta-carotene 3-hydroxylase
MSGVTPAHVLVALLTFMAMEPAVAWVHRHVMHGWGWAWHASHHRPRHGRFERNDLYSVIATALALLLFTVSDPDRTLWWVGAGVTAYGLLYAIVHDGFVHRRLPFTYTRCNGYLRRLIAAHHLHHAVKEREGGVSYGFLYAPPVPVLRQQLMAQRGRHAK